MGLHFILGRSGTGKTTYSLDEIRKTLRVHPIGKPILLIVPDQMTFQAEYELATSDIGGMIRTQVFSFTRLAWRILQETGGMSRYHLTSVGLQMMLRQIVEQQKKQLKVFQSASEQDGFFEELEQMVTEFKRYCLSPEALEQTIHHIQLNRKGHEVIADKLHDLAIIYQAFEQSLIGKYVDSEDYLQLLAEKIPESKLLQEAVIWLDGFHEYSPQEYLVIRMLLKTCASVHVTVTVDPEDLDDLSELDLFYKTKKTYHQLKAMALEDGIAIDRPMILKENKRFQEHSFLRHLEQNFHVRPVIPYEGETDLALYACANRRAEVEGVAREIIQLVRHRGYRYRDLAVFIRSESDYYDLIETIFSDYEIPVFLDYKRSMLHHPLIECLRSSLEAVLHQWRYEAVFRAVKTDLFFPIADFSNRKTQWSFIDQLENYVLSRGIFGKKWTEKKDWIVSKWNGLDEKTIQTDKELKKQREINEWRWIIAHPLGMLEKKLKQATTAKEMCQALYEFLEGLDVPKKIEQMREEAISEWDLDRAREHDQVWNAVIELLDQLVEVAGDQTLSLSVFEKMIEVGLESMTFALVPPAIDQVVVGHIDRSRLTNTKGVFILGVNDGVIPKRFDENGILTDDEREFLSQVQVHLAPSGRRELLDESFLIYLVLTSAKERLWMSYPLADEEGKTLTPSLLIGQVMEIFPSVKEEFLTNEPPNDEQDLEFIVNERKSVSFLANRLSQWKRGYPVQEMWWDVYNVLLNSHNRHLSSVTRSLFYRNEEKPLTTKTSQKLYGKKIQASVSRMEKYKACPFSQFVSYGLRLKEREVFKLEAPDIGQLFHAALKMITDSLRMNKRDFRDLTEQECHQMADQAVGLLAPKIQHEILLSTNRHHYITRKLKQVVGRATSVLSKQAKQSGFSPICVELPFGPKEDIPPLTFTLPNGVVMEIVGRIDRVDKAESKSGVLLRVIDYKSSEKSLQLVDVYYGLSLQMLTYLDVMVTYSSILLGEKALPAGVLYFHMHNPMVQDGFGLSLEEIEQELFKMFRMKGIIVADREIVSLMDQTLTEKNSLIIPVGLKRDGEFTKNSSVLDPSDFNVLQAYTRKTIQQIGCELTSGSIEIAPYNYKKATPCTYCNYRSICQFDESLEGNQYRLLKPTKDQEILAKMAQEVEGVE